MRDERPKQDEDEASKRALCTGVIYERPGGWRVIITTTYTDDKEMKTNLCCMRGDAREV